MSSQKGARRKLSFRRESPQIRLPFRGGRDVPFTFLYVPYLYRRRQKLKLECSRSLQHYSMSKQIEMGWSRFRRLADVFVYLKPLPGMMFLAILIGVQLEAQAQGNLVNLYNWSNETRYSGSPQYNVQISSPDSASFFGSQSTNNSPCPLAVPVLSGSFDTTPGDVYDISFIMQNNFVENLGEPTVSIGAFATNFYLPAAKQAGPGQTQYFPVDISLTYVATSLTTDFTFKIPLDEGDTVSLENLTVTEAPESSTAVIFGTLGCAWVLAQRWLSRFKTRVSPVRSRAV